MEYNCRITKKEIIRRNLGLLIDYKTLIAVIFLVIGYLVKPLKFIFLLGISYFILYLIFIIKSLLSKQKITSLDFIIGEDELIVKVKNQQLIFPFRDIKKIKENSHGLIIKMNRKSEAALRTFEIPYDLEDKHIGFIKELKYRYESYKPKDKAEESFENAIVAFKLSPKKEVIRYIKYSKRIYFNILLSGVCLFISIMLIDSKPLVGVTLIFLAIMSWVGYYIDYRMKSLRNPLICSIERLDNESFEIKGNTFKSIVSIKDVKLLNINHKEYIIKVEGITNESYAFTEKEIIAGDIDNLVKVIGESYIKLRSEKLPILSMISAIISILWMPMVLTPLGTKISLYFHFIFFMVSLVLAIIGLTKKNIIKRFIYVTLFLDLLLLIFYIHVISEIL